MNDFWSICKKLMWKIALTISFSMTALGAIMLPLEAHGYLIAAGLLQNYVWIWKT